MVWYASLIYSAISDIAASDISTVTHRGNPESKSLTARMPACRPVSAELVVLDILNLLD
jgi:hypothetical protein